MRLVWVATTVCVAAFWAACGDINVVNDAVITNIDASSDNTQSGCTSDSDCISSVTLEACQKAVCNAGACEATSDLALNDQACDPGDPCTPDAVCSAGSCYGTPKDCTALDTDKCVVGACNAQTGVCEASLASEGAACDDDDGCTATDACAAGVCAGTAVDCTAYDAICTVGVCTGGQCAPETLVDQPCTPAEQCIQAAICLADGTCVGTPDTTSPGCEINCATAVDGTSCEDGDACTVGDVCAAGSCVGAGMDCSDMDGLCAVGTCADGVCGAQIEDGAVCVSGAACVVDEYCQADGSCVGQPDTVDPSCQCTVDGDCDDGVVCTVDMCGSNGCEFQATDGLCDDSEACTNDTCDPGTGCAFVDNGTCACQTAQDCIDQGTVAGECQSVVCDGSNQCTTEAVTDGDNCDDGDLCTTGDTCQSGACQPTGTVSCNDPADDCKVTQCVAGNCVDSNEADGNACSDGVACTLSDTCTGGSCQAGAWDVTSCGCQTNGDCSDTLSCTDDVCDGSGSCTNAIATGSCLIAGSCYADAAVDSASGCVCDPTQDTTGWSCDPCGNGSIDTGEDCDGTFSEECSDVDTKYYSSMGTLLCKNDCTWNTNGCSECGDGIRDPAELCDGFDVPSGQNCLGQGFEGGLLKCNATCDNFDTGGCYKCGDNVKNGFEDCDNTDFGSDECDNLGLGYSGGDLACDSTCSMSDTGCYACGDGEVNPGEGCDDANSTSGGCDSACQIESGWSCCGAPSLCSKCTINGCFGNCDGWTFSSNNPTAVFNTCQGDLKYNVNYSLANSGDWKTGTTSVDMTNMNSIVFDAYTTDPSVHGEVLIDGTVVWVGTVGTQYYGEVIDVSSYTGFHDLGLKYILDVKTGNTRTIQFDNVHCL